jgi:hypothetical protein
MLARENVAGVRPARRAISGARARRFAGSDGPRPQFDASSADLLDDVKMGYLYKMGSKLVNVRLDEERLQKARLLREDGVVLSDLVREAIDRRFETLERAKRPLDATAIIEQIFERYPDPPDLPPRSYDVTDRRAARDAIARKLRRSAG